MRRTYQRLRADLPGTLIVGPSCACVPSTGQAWWNQYLDCVPCDLYAAGGTACVAAHSTVRALYDSYREKLYQVRHNSDNTTRDIGALTVDRPTSTALTRCDSCNRADRVSTR